MSIAPESMLSNKFLNAANLASSLDSNQMQSTFLKKTLASSRYLEKKGETGLSRNQGTIYLTTKDKQYSESPSQAYNERSGKDIL